MVSDLDEIINFYQWEVYRLELLIEDNILVREFKEAEFNQKALNNANQLLNFHLELKNPLHTQIEHKKWRINHLFKRYDIKNEELKNDPYIQNLKKELADLENIKPQISEETQYIDEALYQLIEADELEYIKLFFNKEFVLKIAKLNISNLKFSISVSDELFNDIFLFRKISKTLKSVGFVLNNQVYELVYPFDNPQNLYPSKIIISRVFFDLKIYLKFERIFYLELIKKPTQ